MSYFLCLDFLHLILKCRAQLCWSRERRKNSKTEIHNFRDYGGTFKKLNHTLEINKSTLSARTVIYSPRSFWKIVTPPLAVYYTCSGWNSRPTSQSICSNWIGMTSSTILQLSRLETDTALNLMCAENNVSSFGLTLNLWLNLRLWDHCLPNHAALFIFTEKD